MICPTFLCDVSGNHTYTISLNVVGGRRFLSGGGPADYDDDNGHGTEVAGVLAALDNGIGIVGVAPGARLWSIKCFDENRAAGSKILAGIEWVIDNADTIDIFLPYKTKQPYNKPASASLDLKAFETAVMSSILLTVFWCMKLKIYLAR